MRTYGRHATEIVAYTFDAETLCPGCTIRALHGNDDWLNAEEFLRELAVGRGVDRMDEHSFDSGDFPKVVFDSGLLDGEKCDHCGEEL